MELVIEDKTGKARVFVGLPYISTVDSPFYQFAEWERGFRNGIEDCPIIYESWNHDLLFYAKELI